MKGEQIWITCKIFNKSPNTKQIYKYKENKEWTASKRVKGTLCPEYFLIGIEGALRKPMTYDDHPSIRPSQSL